MSISILIDQCLFDKKLFLLQPLDLTKPIKRIIYLSEKVHKFVNDETNPRAGKLLSELESFIAGEKLLVSLVPRKARNAKMGLLQPTQNGFWDIRSRDPSPGLRLIGGFSKKDCFIAMNIYERWEMSEPEWRAAIRECDLEWADLFTTVTAKNLPMMTGENPSDYLSNCVCLD